MTAGAWGAAIGAAFVVLFVALSLVSRFGARHGRPSAVRRCPHLHATLVFSGYAFGDPLPGNEQYVGEAGPTSASGAITVYVRCEREAGHEGKHLSGSGREAWLSE